MNEKIYSADIETTTIYDSSSKSIKEVLCYVWGSMNIYNQSDYTTGRSIEDLLKYIVSLQNGSKIYFHNLSFDGSYILNSLLRMENAYQLVDEANYLFNKSANEKLKNIVRGEINGSSLSSSKINSYYVEKNNKGEFIEDKIFFNPLISDMGQWYSISIYVAHKGENKIRNIKIYDSVKLLNMSIEEMAIKFLGIKDFVKLDYDYSKVRLPEDELLDEDYEYLKRDIEILAKSLLELRNMGIKKNTAAGAALFNYKEKLYEEYGSENENMEDVFRKFYPLLTPQVDNFCRRSYKGGISYVSPTNKDRLFETTDTNPIGCSLDCNSLYPSCMYELLPVGEPKYYKGEYIENTDYPLYIQRFRCSFELKDEMCMPIVMLKNNELNCSKNIYDATVENSYYNRLNRVQLPSNKYLESSEGYKVELVMTNVDFNSFKENYYIDDLEFVDGYMFRGAIGLFDNYLEYWKSIKEKAVLENNMTVKGIAKIMMNSLYGKFASKGAGRLKAPYLNEGSLKFEVLLPESSELNYVPTATFITSYGRKKLLEVIKEVRNIGNDLYSDDFDSFLYCDTDSCHCLLTVDAIKGSILEKMIDPSITGKWKIEHSIYKGRYIKAKTYLEQIVPDSEIAGIVDRNSKKGIHEEKEYIYASAIAGLPKDKQQSLTFDKFSKNLTVVNGKLQPKQVKNGIALVAVDFTIR